MSHRQFRARESALNVMKMLLKIHETSPNQMMKKTWSASNYDILDEFIDFEPLVPLTTSSYVIETVEYDRNSDLEALSLFLDSY